MQPEGWVYHIENTFNEVRSMMANRVREESRWQCYSHTASDWERYARENYMHSESMFIHWARGKSIMHVMQEQVYSIARTMCYAGVSVPTKMDAPGDTSRSFILTWISVIISGS